MRGVTFITEIFPNKLNPNKRSNLYVKMKRLIDITFIAVVL